MKRVKKLTIIFVFTLLFAFTLVPTALANSAQSPDLTIVVALPPDDLTLTIRYTDDRIETAFSPTTYKKAWETYFRFYSIHRSDTSIEGAVLVVSSSSINFECSLPASTFQMYSSIVTLNLSDQTVSPGTTSARTVLLISMRVILTLLIEGLILWTFGYRNKDSWISFVVINLITQGVLNSAFHISNIVPVYWIYTFIVYELLIFVVESIAFSIVLTENTQAKAVKYALAANSASLILGGMLISYLPV